MNYNLLHNSDDYDSLKSNYNILKEEFPSDFHLDEIYSRKLEDFGKIEESDKVKKEIVERYIERINKEPEDYSLRYDLSIFYQHTLKEYQKSIKIYRFLIENKYKIDDVSNRDLLHIKLYLCYENLGEYEHSINTLNSSIEELNNQLESLKNSTLFSSNSDVSIKKINELIGENYKRIGHQYRKLNDEKLVTYYLKAIEYSTEHSYWYTSISDWYFQNQDYDNYQKYMDLWIDTDEYFEFRVRKKNKPRMLSITLKKYILQLFQIGFEVKSLNLCRELIQKTESDYELPNIFSILNEFDLIKKSKTEKQYIKWVKSKQLRFKNLKKKLHDYLENNPEFELSSRIKYEPFSWKNPDIERTRKRVKSKKIEEKSILNALKELENDIFLVSELFETTPYQIFKIQMNSDKNHLKLLK